MDQYRFTNGRLTLSGPLLISNVGPLYEALNVLLASYSGAVELDLTDVSEMDSAGVAMIDLLAESLRSRGMPLTVNNVSSDLGRTMTAFSLQEPKSGKEEEAPTGLLERLGGMALARGKEVVEYLFLTADAFYYTALGLFNRKNYRKGEFTNQCIQIGMNAFPIVALIAFLIGFILALQSAAQLRQFGAAIYVADLIAISMTREMGPLITAIIFSGRSGSAIASEIATMKVTEETDALKSMGLNPIAYVLTPKIYAIVLMMPLLTILSVVIGILGAMVIGWSYLEISPEAFYREVLTVLYLRDITTGLIKSLVFAWLVALTGAYYGFRVRGGAEAVGRATTASVVTSIFLVIVADSILGLVFYFGRGLEY